jgi:radical SAM superfamily enzyme YgiQ (UPF0313 family)
MGKIRVLLIYASEIQSNEIDDFLRVPPIGLFFINGYLKHKGYESRIIHAMPDHFSRHSTDSESYREELRKEIEEFAPHYIGYSFRNLLYWGGIPRNPTKLINYFSMSLEKPIVEFLQGITSAKVIGGGSGFSLAPELFMNYLNLDYGIVGEGERAFEELVSKLEDGEDISKIAGLVYRKNGAILTNPNRFIDDLNSLPPMETGNFRGYREIYCSEGGYANVQTKRGCSFRCIYCQYPFLEGSKYRLRDVTKVVQEVIDIKNKYDIRRFFIVDSVFSTPANHSMKFCEELIKRNADIEWAAYINPRGIEKELLEIYRKSGCHYLTLTADSLSARVLESYQKDFTIDDVKKSVQLLKESSIPFEISLILGGIGEDEESVQETVEFCDKYLKDISVSFFAGMWVHPVAQAIEVLRSERIFSENENIDYNRIIKTNDFETNLKLKYFFPHVKEQRKKFLDRIFAKIQKDKRKIIGLKFASGGRVL